MTTSKLPPDFAEKLKAKMDDFLQNTDFKAMYRARWENDGLFHHTPLSWSKEIKSLALDFRVYSIPSENAKKIVNAAKKEEREEVYELLVSNIQNWIDDYGLNRFYLKLETRSPKDHTSESNGTVPPFENAKDAALAIMNSIRVCEDLVAIGYIRDNINFIMSRPIENSFDKEYRCFVRGGVCYGITKYYEINSVDLKNNKFLDILNFVNTKIAPIYPIGDFVVDVIYNEDKIVILEFNPYGLSDPRGLNYHLIEDCFKDQKKFCFSDFINGSYVTDVAKIQ